MSVDTSREAVAEILVLLMRAGITADVQELLTHGDGRGKVAPGALGKAIAPLLARVEKTEAERDEARAEVAAAKARIEAAGEVVVETAASLAAAISLLERGSKKAAASDRMFDIMLQDYKKALEAARAWLEGK